MSVDNLREGFSQLHFNTSASIMQDRRQSPYFNGYKNKRNLQCVPSDDEEEDDNQTSEEEDDDDDNVKIALYKKTTRSITLSNDNEEDNDIIDQTSRKIKSHPKLHTLRQTRMDNTSNKSINEEGALRMRRISYQQQMVDEDDEIIGQNLRYQQPYDALYQTHHYQYHQQQQLQQQQYQHQHQHQHQHQQQQQQQKKQQMRMSGMDLLIQREQEKAEAKRQKPKIVPGKVKIEGLLGKLPEPGAHNISFQQLQLQQQHQVKTKKSNKQSLQYQLQQQQQQQQQQFMFDYGRPVSSMMYNAPSSTIYQLPTIPISNGNLFMTYPTATTSTSTTTSTNSRHANTFNQKNSSNASLPFV
ncbi:hypothetical protein G6F70_007028 [Rhizopus microsporus]|uniref:Uncharacterized protein n=2 Tax=Rhizopus TaxID=4842 RepID=A0A367JRR5_RHIAZ|nr:hypothetical protein G6F71_006797 [Rhizopus microsporus]RCH92596.1 hypothetical protein CU097_012744 [Rhizopus azygosporus]KAG1196950.1 hypothetical protein G6F70_007028 [Rhizopus microsporus]KAG1208829.1 hypothetical protein G6F69_006881 [Rhizopus microsporus]KAG1230197.1 hypothetical protein G6F67_006628 [Rhizopus microsporus]